MCEGKILVSRFAIPGGGFGKILWHTIGVGVAHAQIELGFGQPLIGRVDGTAAISGDRGFVFLFNPNYRALDAEFPLDASIGLTKGRFFAIKELYPEEGKGIGHPENGLWGPGDKVRIPMGRVLEIAPAPDGNAVPAPSAAAPLLFGVRGKAVLRGDELALTDLAGEAGLEQAITVVVPGGAAVKALTVDGAPAAYVRKGNVVGARVKFAGAPFRAPGRRRSC